MKEDINETWLDTEGAAKYIKVSKEQLRNLVAGGYIPYRKLLSRNRYEKTELDELLDRHKKGGWRYGCEERSEDGEVDSLPQSET